MDPSDADAQSILAFASLMEGNFADAFERVALALSHNPNSFWANATEGAALVFTGHPVEGREELLRALRLSPHDPSDALFPNVVTWSYYFERDYANAIAAAGRVISHYPEFPLSYRLLAAAFAQLGRTDEAREALQKARAISPQSSFALNVSRRLPWYRPRGPRTPSRRSAESRVAGLTRAAVTSRHPTTPRHCFAVVPWVADGQTFRPRQSKSAKPAACRAVGPSDPFPEPGERYRPTVLGTR